MALPELPPELLPSADERVENARLHVVVGMSGGVDSSVSALLLKAQGYRVEGVFMQNWEDDDEHCTARQDYRDAAAVARRLDMPLSTVNFAEEYWERVFTHFLEEYGAGRTPNPDILCNREIKFRAFLDHARTLGADRIATGHYVRRGPLEDEAVAPASGLAAGVDDIGDEGDNRQNSQNSQSRQSRQSRQSGMKGEHGEHGEHGENGEYGKNGKNGENSEYGEYGKGEYGKIGKSGESDKSGGIDESDSGDSRLHAGSLLRGLDPDKDQSYFLHTLDRSQLAPALFPVGSLEKRDVRRLARDAGFLVHGKKDSTGICFIGERKFRSFLAEYLPAQSGDIVDENGTVLGRHDGLMFHTLGQRQGLRIGGMKGSGGAPWYVLAKDLDANRLIVGQGHDHPKLLQTSLTAEAAHWIAGEPPATEFRCTARVRYRQEDTPCRIRVAGDGRIEAHFDEPVRAATPGQSIVAYAGATCLGGAIISELGTPPSPRSTEPLL